MPTPSLIDGAVAGAILVQCEPDRPVATAALLRAASSAMTACLQSALKPFDLSPGQWHALDALRRTGRIRATQAAGLLALDTGAASRVFDGLVRRGLCHRERATSDRRAVMLAPTMAGCRLVSQSAEAVEAALLWHFSGVLPNDFAAFLRVIAATASRWPGGGSPASRPMPRP